MAKNNSLLLILRVFLFTLTGATLLISPFLMKVWKEGEGHQLSIKKSSLEKELVLAKSKSETVSVAIKALLANRRLKSYAADSLSLREPKQSEVLVLRRERDGQVLKREEGVRHFLEEMMRPQ